MLRTRGWQSFVQWFQVVQSVWCARRGLRRHRPPMRGRHWALPNLQSRRPSSMQLRNPLFEPLEQRQVLTAGLSYDATPFSIDPTTQNITVHYELSTAASAAFDIALFADDGVSPAMLVSESVSNPSLWSVGSHTFTFSAPFSTEPQEDYRLSVVLDPGDAHVTEEFTGVFLEDSGILQVFGTSGADAIEISPESGSQIRITLNSVDHFFDESDVTDIHVRSGADDDYVEVLDEVDVPYWGFGGDGADLMKGSAGASYLNGGAGDDQLANGTGPLEVEGGTGTDMLAVLGTDDADGFYAWFGTMIINGESIDYSGVEQLGVGLGAGDDTIVVIESELTTSGISELLIVNVSGNNSVGIAGPFTGPAQPGLSSVYVYGGDDNDSVVFSPQNITRGPGAILEFHGGGGDDTISIGQYSNNALPSSMDITVDGGDGNDSLSIDNVTSTYTSVYDDRVSFLGGVTIDYDSLDSIAIDTTNELYSLVWLSGGSAKPAMTLTGDEEDELALQSVTDGSIDSSYAAGTTTFAIDGPTIDVTTTGIANFLLEALEVSIDGIALNQAYVVHTFVSDGSITLSGDVTIPSGFATGEQQVLVDNISAATLYGRFDHDGHHDIILGGDGYDVQYISDVTLESANYSGSTQVTTSAILTHHDTIPRFVNVWMEPDASDVNRSIYTGDWSDPDIWSLGHVPTDGELVRILQGTVVTYDVVEDTDAIRAIEVIGSLVFETEADTHLLVGTLQVLPGGMLEIGSESSSIDASKTATVEFADQAIDAELDPTQFGTGLIGFGTVTIHGTPFAETWLRLSAEVAVGATYIDVTGDISDWRPDDVLVLPDSRHFERENNTNHWNTTTGPFAGQWETVEIDYIVGQRVYLTSAVQYDHKGSEAFNWDDGAPGYITEFYPHVALLTRNVVIESENPTGTRGHTLYGGRAEVDIQYADFNNLGRTTNDPLGPSNQVGRYSVHFHHLMGPVNPTEDLAAIQYMFKGNTVQNSLRWAIAVHQTSFGLLEDNVIYRAHGAGFVTETGNEVGNRFVNNITIGMEGTFKDGKSGTLENDFARGGVGFWFRRLGNIISGNVASGSTYAGYVITGYYLPETQLVPDFPGANLHNAGQTSEIYLMPFNPLPSLYEDEEVFFDNEAYGRSAAGLWAALTLGNMNLDHDAENPDSLYHTEIVDLRLWNLGNDYAAWVYHTNYITLDGPQILGDRAAQSHPTGGTRGLYLDSYENKNLVVKNARIEGFRTGIVAPNLDGSVPGEVQRPTIVENAWLRNWTNVTVSPNDGLGSGLGNGLLLDSVWFDLIPVGASGFPTTPTSTSENIKMSASGSSLTQFSYVHVVDYRVFGDDPEAPGQDFQVFYELQAQAATMPQTDLDNWYRSLGTSVRIGSPESGKNTAYNWATHGIAYGGFPVPSGVTPNTTIPDIQGIVVDKTELPGDEFVDMSSFDPKVVIVTPWDGSEFPQQPSGWTGIRYLVYGLLDDVDSDEARVWYSVNGGAAVEHSEGDSGFTQGKILLSGASGLGPGDHTVRMWIGDENGDEFDGFENTGSQVSFRILPTIDSVAESEGNAGTTPFVFTVHLVKKTTDPFTVQYTTVDGTATSASGDYVATSGTLTFAVGENVKTITVLVNGDTTPEGDETFKVVLSSPSKSGYILSTQGTGTIQEIPTISVDSPTLAEGDSGTTNLVFAVSLSFESDAMVTVEFNTADVSATAGSDYVATSGTLTFAPGVTTQLVTVQINGDTDLESDETFKIELSNATEGLLAALPYGTGTITNDD